MMIDRIKGHAWKLGDNVDTDVITPTKYLSLPLEEMKRYALEPILPLFAAEVKPGDVIVAGKNFGCGSSRETAVTALKALRVGGIVAESFSRIYFRNAIAQGLPILTLQGAAGLFDQGDMVEIDLQQAQVQNLTRGQEYNAVPLTGDMLAIINQGGILALLKKKMTETT